MRIHKSLVATLLLAGATVAVADPAPPAPDFQDANAAQRDVDRDSVASDADRRLQPVDLVLFEQDSYALDRADIAELGPVREWLAKHPEGRVIVEGYTDRSGSRAYNQELSRRRALAVRDALIADGVPNGKIYLSAFGEDTPIPGPAANARRVRVWGQLPPPE